MLAVSKEEFYHEKLLNAKFAWGRNTSFQADTVRHKVKYGKVIYRTIRSSVGNDKGSRSSWI